VFLKKAPPSPEEEGAPPPKKGGFIYLGPGVVFLKKNLLSRTSLWGGIIGRGVFPPLLKG